MRAYKGPGQSRAKPPASEEGGAVDSGGWGATGSYLDRLQNKPASEDTAAQRPPGPPPPPRAQGPAVPTGPSDYTRVIRGAAVPPVGRPGPEPPPTFGTSPVQPQQQPKPAPPASRTPIIVALVVTAALLVAVILFFALRSS